ncbi:hypothetical protein ASG49_09950 [Marmoricola sp. Leaf446]|nr:hypothetical protein ASG49_09950 [Marmoricola sp. Leaf446]
MGGAARLGLGVEPLDDTRTFVKDDSTKLPELVARFDFIPGMLPQRRCIHLYMLALGGVQGDIAEIGSWQGKSTAYLAQACADTGNGIVHAIDTFEGNPGHEQNYSVGGSRVNLKESFVANMERAGVADWVRIHAKSSIDAFDEVSRETAGLRLLFIDGEHTYEAVKNDLELYANLVLPGGLIVFDDYAPGFEGDVRAVLEHVSSNPGRYGRPFQQKNTLVLPRLHGQP